MVIAFPETDIWRRSHAVDELFGFAPGESGAVAANFFARLHADDLPGVRAKVTGILGSPDQTVVNFQYRVILPSGVITHIASRGEVLRTSSGKARMIGVMMHVTADRQREAALTSSLKTQGDLLEQKEALLAEVNHRVKNSLQLVVSTLRLQARRIQDPTTAEANLARGTNGVETAAGLRQRWDVPCLFVSGILDELTRERASQWQPIGFVGKPYSEREILSALNTMTAGLCA